MPSHLVVMNTHEGNPPTTMKSHQGIHPDPMIIKGRKTMIQRFCSKLTIFDKMQEKDKNYIFLLVFPLLKFSFEYISLKYGLSARMLCIFWSLMGI